MTFTHLQSQSNTISRLQVAIVCLGNTVAYFDFLIYLYLADVIARTFFPFVHNPLYKNIETISIFAAGYLSRPIGALLIGRYGDIYGRKPALRLSLGFMAITMFITVFLPTFAQAGVTASLLFVATRLIQGMAFGAHAPLGWVYIAEHVSIRRLAFYCSLISASFIMANLVSNIFANLLLESYTISQMSSYAWRIPFAIGSLLSFIAFLLSKRLPETPLFLENKYNRQYVPRITNLVPSLRRLNSIFLTLILTFSMSSLIIVIALILPSLILMKFSIDTIMLDMSYTIGLFFMILGCLFYGLIADKFSIGRTLMPGAIILVIQALAFYYHLRVSTGEYILIMYVMLGFSSGIIGLFPAIMVQLFPTRVRVTAVSLTYNCTYALTGSLLPLGLYYATDIVSYSPVLYLVFVSLVTFIIGLYMYLMPKFRQLAKLIDA